MGTVTLNLKSRELEPRTLSSWHSAQFNKSKMRAIRNHVGIKTARKLAKMLKDARLCPVVVRHSFSKVTINY